MRSRTAAQPATELTALVHAHERDEGSANRSYQQRLARCAVQEGVRETVGQRRRRTRRRRRPKEVEADEIVRFVGDVVG
jgi:hypothetical protein